MWFPKGYNQVERKVGKSGSVAVAIDKDRGSQQALKWATDTLMSRGQTVMLIHVRLKGSIYSSQPHPPNRVLPYDSEQDQSMRELFLPFRCFCTRKDMDSKDVILEDADVVKALIEYVTQAAIENLVVGCPTKNGFLRRFKMIDIPGSITKGAPDFCNVYVISKGKVSYMRSASRPAPAVSPLHQQIQSHTVKPDLLNTQQHPAPITRGLQYTLMEPRNMNGDINSIKSPFTRGKAANGKSYGELSMPENDISFVSSGRPSTDHAFPLQHDTIDMTRTPPRLSSSSDTENSSFEGLQFARKSLEYNSPRELSLTSHDSDNCSWSSQAFEDVEAEMRRLKLELKQTMDMYSTACKEALVAKQKAMELQRWKLEEEQRLEEARVAEEAALAIAEKEKVKSRAALEHAEAAKRIAELESQKRVIAEMKAVREAEEKKRALDALAHSDVRYRKYPIEEIEAATEYFSEAHKIGEGGYGPVYKCCLDHTQVAIKVLRPDAAQGRSQFQQEVEILSCIRHPNMVLLLGACPDYGCLVYDYMANGSLEDCLFRRGTSPSLPWQLRFKIAAEIGTGLLFLHQTKPEPLVHRDLKPGNILLDRNYVSKISDVGLARLVPPSVADTVTQYRMTSTAGTFCYIDPEYQQTGMLGIKSDIYSLGIMLLQLVTAKPPMGLTHHVDRAIENSTFGELLDPSVPDWPAEEALSFAKIALQCAELRRKDRPDLGKVVLPQLNRFREVAEQNMHPSMVGWEGSHSASTSPIYSIQDVLSDGDNVPSDLVNSRSRSSTQ